METLGAVFLRTPINPIILEAYGRVSLGQVTQRENCPVINTYETSKQGIKMHKICIIYQIVENQF